MVILPTGCGKTHVMGLAPFFLNATAVIIITPDKTINYQVTHHLSDLYKYGSSVAKTIGSPLPTVSTYEAGKNTVVTNVVVANIQALVEGGNGADAENTGTTIKEAFAQFLIDRKFDLCIIDEGHHCPAKSWEAVERRLLGVNPACRTILLTATPLRSDGVRFNLHSGTDYYYLCKRADAVRDGYIKSTQPHPIEVDFQAPATKYCNESYLAVMLDAAVQKLKDLRASCNNIPVRMLVSARTNKSARTISEFFNRRYNSDNLKAVDISGDNSE